MRKKIINQYMWHMWFAWYPVEVISGYTVWLEYVWRRKKVIVKADYEPEEWEYI